jgi:hypothetical protein
MKILFFLPGNGIWNWVYPPALLAESLRKKGHEVKLITCQRDFTSFCMTQAAQGVFFDSTPEKKEDACRRCTANAGLISSGLSLPSRSMGTYLREGDLTDVESFVQAANLSDYEKLSFGQVPVGRISLFELIIQKRKSSFQLAPEDLAHYRAILRNSVFATRAFERVLEEEKPDLIVVEHTEYSYNKAVQLLAEVRGVPSYFVNANSLNVARMYEQLILASGDPYNTYSSFFRNWSAIKDQPAKPDELDAVFDHFSALIQAKGHVYSGARSNGRDLHALFGIKPEQKVLLATMSSYDEMLALQIAGGFDLRKNPGFFPSQLEWIRSLIEFVKARPDLFLIVRVHPREYAPDHRGEISGHAKLIRAELRDLPINVKVNTPDQGLSLYDLVDIVDVGLNAWSSAGAEMSFFGIPVVAYCPELFLYPSELNICAQTEAEYFASVDRALGSSYGLAEIRGVARWYAVQSCRIALNMSDSFPYSALRQRSFFERALNALLRRIHPLLPLKLQVWKRASRLQAGDQAETLFQKKLRSLPEIEDLTGRDAATEDRALRQKLRDLHGLLYGQSTKPAVLSRLRARLEAILEPRV